jgi:TonB-linked SusC/RagA family outer membrane protein
MMKLTTRCAVLSLCAIPAFFLSAGAMPGKPEHTSGKFNVFQQPSAAYQGTVLDKQKRPVARAIVRNISGNSSFKTDAKGFFAISGNAGDSLSISAPGFVPSYYVLQSVLNLSIELQQEESIVIQQDKPVERIYTTVPARLNLASNDAVYTNDLIKAPVTSVRNAIAGRLTGLYTDMYSGQPGTLPDGVVSYLRGQQDPLIIVDGVVTPVLSTMDFEEIESVTALKDAVGLAMLGVRGNKGALVITTRKGKADRQQISFTVQTATQTPLGLPKTLSAYDHAVLYNEAIKNDNLTTTPFSATALQAFKDHSDPLNYPDIDWRKQVTNNSARFNRYSLNATGGNQFARYFVALEHVNQSGFFKTVDSNSYNTNNNFKTFLVRSNVDVNISPKLTAGIYLLGRILNSNEPGAVTGGILGNLLNTPNSAYPIFNADGSYGGSQQYSNNIWAQTVGSGYRQNYKRDMLVNIYLRRTLDEVTKGLWLQVKAAYNGSVSENYTRNKSFAVFQKTTTGSYQQFGTNGTQANTNNVEFQERRDYEEVSLGYDRTFGGKHGINALVLANRDNSVGRENGNLVDGSNLPYTISGGSGRVSYSYKGKYVAEVAFGMNGSNRYPDNGDVKLGFFPAFGLGWNIEHETFMQKLNWINHLKLYGSFGTTGWDRPGYFTYIQRFFDGTSPVFGTSAGGVTGITQQPLANPNVTFEKSQKLNVGIEAAFLKNRLTFTVEYYNNKDYDILMQRGRNTALIGNSYPDENIGRFRYTGFEGRLGWQESINEFSYYISANLSAQQSEVLYVDEVFRQYDWMKRTGRKAGLGFGYIANGLYQSQSEITGSATIDGYTPQPGDIRYKDLNTDGVINQFDVAPITNEKPLITYGLALGAQFKGIDISAFIQGVQNRNIYLAGASYWAFQGNNGQGQAYVHNLDRWTPSNPNASYPRVHLGTNNNNYATSSYWVRNGSYFRLKSVEIGYTLPTYLTNKVKLHSVRVFANGFNVLTHADDSIDDRDPEVYDGNYPIQRLFNFGINIKL